MTSRRCVAAALAVAATVMTASHLELPARAAMTRNRLAANRLAANRLAANRLAANRLAANALTSTKLEASTASAEMLATTEGRELYSYLVSCALPAGTTIEAAVPNAPDGPGIGYTCAGGRCTFDGSMGLAADWAEQKLSSKDERWVSACVFARVNLFDTGVGISLRGSHSALAISQEEAEDYTLIEGAFYGNLFTHEDDPIDINACLGEGEAATPDDGGLSLRDCAEEDPTRPGLTMCGFTYAGHCAPFAAFPSTPYACKRVDAQGTYADCHDTAAAGHWPASKTYREVITVYVTQ
jgi:hypothetical protein